MSINPAYTEIETMCIARVKIMVVCLRQMKNGQGMAVSEIRSVVVRVMIRPVRRRTVKIWPLIHLRPRPPRRWVMQRVDQDPDSLVQLIIDSVELLVAGQAVRRDPEPHEDAHQDQAVPDLQPPLDRFENLHRALFNAVTVAAPRHDEFRPQFFTDVGDMNIQQIRHRTLVFVEQMFV